MELQKKIIDFIEASRVPPAPVKDPDEPLNLDSLGVLRLTAFLDNDCGISLDDEDITIENFKTMRRLEELIASKSRAGETEERP
jgi:acyl carrier protein